jgi:flagellar motor protein MotB
MKSLFISGALAALSLAPYANGQEAPDQKSGSAPIYRVTVVRGTIKAVNYQYRSGPTTIDFRGTVLLPEGKGQATVESKRGRTEIEASFDHLVSPVRFGREYLTYTLWAVTPQGGVRNLAEIVPGPSDKAKLRLSTDLQAFGLMVTAEPYSAVRNPSNVVVLENQVRPDTAGKVEEIDARYELMPRGQYTLDISAKPQTPSSGPKVSMNQYEALMQIYEAQNALGIAQAARADHYAPETYARAQQLLEEAKRLQAHKGSTSVIVEEAREAAQTAEDARAIADRRMEDEKLAKANADLLKAQQDKSKAEAEAQRARAEAEAARAQAEELRTARERAEEDARTGRDRSASPRVNTAPPVAPPPPPPPRADPPPPVQQPKAALQAQKTALRTTLTELLNQVLPALDTGRGLVVTVKDHAFEGSRLLSSESDQVARLAVILVTHPGLRLSVEGNTDSPETDDVAAQRAESVRRVLVAHGLPAANVQARGLGDSRLLGPNVNDAGRMANRRVEIVISGDPIGELPAWEHTYNLTQR